MRSLEAVWRPKKPKESHYMSILSFLPSSFLGIKGFFMHLGARNRLLRPLSSNVRSEERRLSLQIYRAIALLFFPHICLLQVVVVVTLRDEDSVSASWQGPGEARKEFELKYDVIKVTELMYCGDDKSYALLMRFVATTNRLYFPPQYDVKMDFWNHQCPRKPTENMQTCLCLLQVARIVDGTLRGINGS